MKRSFRIILLVFFILLTAFSSGLRLIQAIVFWKVLLEYGANVSYIAVSGGVWLLISLFLLVGVWLRTRWAWAGTIMGASCYGFWYWIDRLAVEIPHANWPFALVLSIIFTGIIALIIFTPGARFDFKEQV
jgi:hypothetical protein